MRKGLLSLTIPLTRPSLWMGLGLEPSFEDLKCVGPWGCCEANFWGVAWEHGLLEKLGGLKSQYFGVWVLPYFRLGQIGKKGRPQNWPKFPGHTILGPAAGLTSTKGFAERAATRALSKWQLPQLFHAQRQ